MTRFMAGGSAWGASCASFAATAWPALLEGRFEGRRVHPSAAVASLMAFAMRYRVLPVLCGDHAAGAALTERILLLFARMVERDCKALRTGQEGEMEEVGDAV